MNDPKQKKSKKKLVIPVIILCILLLFAALLATGYLFLHSKMKMMRRVEEPITPPDPIVIAEPVPEEPESEPHEMTEEEKRAAEELAKILAAEDEIFSDSNVFNVMLLGTDERTEYFNDNARGDTCMLLSVNKKTLEVKLISFERGMGVPILDGEYAGQWDWLTHTFRYGGGELITREVRECFKIDVTRYLRANFSVLINGIDLIGGVDVNLTEAEAEYLNKPGVGYGDPSQEQYVTPGWNHINGTMALDYARCRAIDSDWRRVERQRTVVQSAIDQTKHLSLFEINDLLNEIVPTLETNLTDSEVLSLILLAPRYQGVTMAQKTIPVEGTFGTMVGMGGRSLFAVDFEANAKILQEMLYGTDVKE